MTNFSIIIPVYNAEKTLRRCLDSILRQTFSDYEVILVDDGSKDSSLDICKSYCAKDKRFSVYHQENGGPSKARNLGLDKAEGKWICFIDSDDSVAVKYLQKIFNAICLEGTEAVFWGYYELYNDGKKIVHIPNVSKEEKMITCIELSQKNMFGYTWIKCFKNESIGDVRFDLELDLYEDEVFACQVVSKCKKIQIINEPIYNYSVGEGNTLIGKTHEDYCLKCEKVYLAWKKLLTSYQNRRFVLECKANAFVDKCRYYGMERDVNVKTFFETLRSTSFFIEHTLINTFDNYVKKGKYLKISWERKKYRIRIFVSNAMHRCSQYIQWKDR